MAVKPVVPPAMPEYRFENALKWIQMISGLHYFGGAFEPKHMRHLAAIAGSVLAGETELPDFNEAMAESQRKASIWADRLGMELTEETDGGEGPDE